MGSAAEDTEQTPELDETVAPEKSPVPEAKTNALSANSAGGEAQRSATRGPSGDLWSRRNFFLGVAALCVTLLVAWGTGILGAVGAVGDGMRDLLRSSDGRQADDLREAIQRDDRWLNEPRIDERGFEYMRANDDASLATIDDFNQGGGVPVASTVGVNALVADAVTYSGSPYYIIGRVVSSRAVATDILEPIQREIVMAGPKGPERAIVGVGGPLEVVLEEGDLAMIRGVILATGEFRLIKDGRTDAAYVRGYDSIPIDTASAELKYQPPDLRAIAEEFEAASR